MAVSISNLKSSNPYVNQSYYKSPWQNFLSKLGFRTEADAWQENMSVQAAEYDAALAQKQYDQEYNEPLAQVERMRNAGLNPDIDGGSNISSGQAAPLGEDPSTPMQSTGAEDKIIGAAQTIMTALSTGIGLARSLGDLSAIGITNAEGKLVQGERTSQFAKWLIDNTLTNQFELNDNAEPEYQMSQKLNRIFKDNKRFIPFRLRKQFRSNLYEFAQSLNNQVNSWNATKVLGDTKLDVARQVESKYFGNGEFDTMRIANKGLVKLSDSLSEIILKRQNAEEGYKHDYFNNLSGDEAAAAENAANSNKRLYEGELDPLAKAQSENATNSFVAQQKDIDKIINSTMSEIVHDLKRQADKGDIFAESMLFSFAIARMSQFSIGPKGFSFGFNK